jgi:hypothetical protein
MAICNPGDDICRGTDKYHHSNPQILTAFQNGKYSDMSPHKINPWNTSSLQNALEGLGLSNFAGF